MFFFQFYLEENRADSSAPSETSPLMNHDADAAVALSRSTSVSGDPGMIVEDNQIFRKLSYLLATWLAIFVSAVVKGGDGAKGYVECGSSPYWAVVLLPAAVAVPLTITLGKELVVAAERNKQMGFKAERGDIIWDRRCTTLYPAICFACGIAAGALGIAAGMILSPILLELGMIPAVAAATSGFSVLFTSSCTRCEWDIRGLLL